MEFRVYLIELLLPKLSMKANLLSRNISLRFSRINSVYSD